MAKSHKTTMGDKSNHDASGQLAGYLYQILYALKLLVENRNPDTNLCIEKFDDVSFSDMTGVLTDMYQLKHHLSATGNLGNTSVDFWRSIKSWVDSIKSNPQIINNTKFVIITTGSTVKNSIASYLLADDNRNVKEALKLMKKVVDKNTPDSNEKYYQSFSSLTDAEKEKLVNNIVISTSADTIDNVKDALLVFVRLSVRPGFEEKAFEKLSGWWIQRVVECLVSTEAVFISYHQLRAKMNDISSEYQMDALPIDVDPLYSPNEDELNALLPERRAFIEQLRLIALSEQSMKRCIRDYYNAYRQRSLWVREQLLYIDDLTSYENRLRDEWERLYFIMVDEIEDYGDEITEKEMQKKGRQLLHQVEDLNIHIRKNITDPFIMRGSYHGLSNQRKVGWHVDFMNRLCSILGE